MAVRAPQIAVIPVSLTLIKRNTHGEQDLMPLLLLDMITERGVLSHRVSRYTVKSVCKETLCPVRPQDCWRSGIEDSIEDAASRYVYGRHQLHLGHSFQRTIQGSIVENGESHWLCKERHLPELVNSGIIDVTPVLGERCQRLVGIINLLLANIGCICKQREYILP